MVRMDQPSNAIKLIDEILGIIDATDATVVAELTEIKLSAQKALGLHFANLPDEVIIKLIGFLIGEKEATLLALTRVCKAWRQLILDTPSFWTRLSISSSTDQEKIDTWSERSRGELLYLTVRHFPFDSRPDALAAYPPHFWSGLKGLDVEFGSQSTALPFPSDMKLNLESLGLRDTTCSAFTFEIEDEDSTQSEEIRNTLLEAVDLSSLSMIRTQTKAILPALTSCSMLTKLSIQANQFSMSTLLIVLLNNPSLEVVDLEPVMDMFNVLNLLNQVSDSSSRHVLDPRISLPNLHTLLFCHGLRMASELITHIDVPSLRTLSIIDGAVDFRILGRTFPCLHTLYMQSCEVMPIYDPTLPIIENAPSLRDLKVSNCDALGNDGKFTNFVVERLSCRKKIVCPNLRTLDLRNSPNLTGDAIVQSLMTRLPEPLSSLRIQTAGEKHPALRPFVREALEKGETPNGIFPLWTLKLGGCYKIDERSLRWLYSRVPFVSADDAWD
jgi:hypothetical protein